ncbi:MAG TPA: tetratricopeptide repeat protein [Solirubrobacterales bacterium]|nr:tetratricopeptide repeat protein [Solirubrobacterales bacterium]
MIHDVAESEFQTAVIDRSAAVPVVVDFWAEWCGPCRQLGPALEAEARKRGDDVDLAKVDVDSNQQLAQSFGVQGIPAVKAFRDGKVADEFTGAIPPAQVAEFFNGLVPSEADRLAASGDEADLRRALELDPKQSEAATALARILIARGEAAEAIELLEPITGDFLAAGLRARAELATADDANGAAFAAWDEGRHGDALEALQTAVAEASGQEDRDRLRAVMVAIFTELGPTSDLAREHRRRLALALN